jgi:hypothetical protein
MRLFRRKPKGPLLTKADFDAAVASLVAVIAQAVAKLAEPPVVPPVDLTEETAAVVAAAATLTAALAPPVVAPAEVPPPVA